MFGGVGFFICGVMFGMIGGDTFRLKVDESNRADFESKGVQPYFSEKKKKECHIGRSFKISLKTERNYLYGPIDLLKLL